MTMKITIECDRYGCHASTEIEDTYDSAVHAAGWHVDPHDGYQHFCPRCWPEAKKRLEQEDGEE